MKKISEGIEENEIQKKYEGIGVSLFIKYFAYFHQKLKENLGVNKKSNSNSSKNFKYKQKNKV